MQKIERVEGKIRPKRCFTIAFRLDKGLIYGNMHRAILTCYYICFTSRLKIQLQNNKISNIKFFILRKALRDGERDYKSI